LLGEVHWAVELPLLGHPIASDACREVPRHGILNDLQKSFISIGRSNFQAVKQLDCSQYVRGI
jgi:hypothetical protein